MTKERRAQISRESYLRNKQKVLEKSHARYWANRELKLAQGKAYREAHPEVAQKATKKYRDNNPERCRQTCRSWYHRNLEQERARGRKKNRVHYANNKAKVLEANRKWREQNKDKVHARDLRRRALKKGAKVNLAHIREWMDGIKSKRHFRCYYCDHLFSTDLIHFDHIVALKNGGEHRVENLCASCGACNCSKKDKEIGAWVRVGQQVLPL